MFSFNNPFGACPKCTGLGVFLRVDPALIIPDPEKTIAQGAIKGSGWAMEGNTIAQMYMDGLAEKYGFDYNTPVKELPQVVVDKILYGTNGEKLHLIRRTPFNKSELYREFEGIIPNLERRFRDSNSQWIKEEIQSYMTEIPCDECKGKRLSAISLAVTVGGMNIADLCDMSVVNILDFIEGIEISERDRVIAGEILNEIKSRLNFLRSVGLGYLTLSRASATLSGGESQRIRLATQIGSALMGVLYILDEPSIGLHQRDNDKLLSTLKKLRDIGNTVIVVEHDEDTMRTADYIVDIGPGAGVHGGEIVATGSVEDIKACEKSMTGQYLSGKRSIPVPEHRREGNGKQLTIRGAKQNNLKNIDVNIPLGKFVCVTGVSGSGKSSLINEILYKHLARELNHAKTTPGKFKEITGLDALDKVAAFSLPPPTARCAATQPRATALTSREADARRVKATASSR